MKAHFDIFVKMMMLLCLPLTLMAQQTDTIQSDSSVVMCFRIFYPINKADIHEDYMDNANQLHHIRKYLEKSPKIENITIYSYASPEGSYSLNKRLAQERGKTTKRYLMDLIPVERQFPDSLVVFNSTAENWDGLRELVYYQYQHDDKNEILAILDRTDITNEYRKVLLKRLHRGKSWRYIIKEIMPQLRYATWISVRQRIPVEEKINEPVRLAMEIPVVEKPFLQPLPLSSRLTDNEEVKEYPWVLKSNLLYDVLLSPSIEAEYRFDSHWSAHVDYAVAWWSNKSKHKYYQLMQFSPEVRYWFNSKKYWKGHYIGTFVGAGYYDLENGQRGYKGEYLMGGVSYGYMFPIGKYMSIDVGIGVGYLNTKYEEYLPIEGHYVYQQTSRTGYVGPVKARLSLVWHWGRKWLKGGAR